MRHRLGLGLTLALAACAPAFGEPGDALERLARYELKDRHPDLYGVSAVEWDGTAIWLLTDRGALFSGSLIGDQLTLNAPIYPMVPRSRPVDAEALALGPDGLHLGGEGPARVYDLEGDMLRARATFAPFRELGRNRGIEALAVAENGDLWAIPETPSPVSVYVHDRDGWYERMRLDLPSGLVTAADFDDRARLYLIAREITPPFGITLWRLDRAGLEALGRWTALDVGNVEGLAIQRIDGGLQALMVSDDNGNGVQPSRMLRFALPD